MPLPDDEAQQLPDAVNEAQGHESTSFCTLFFYGTLMDPDVLQKVAGLSSPPDLQDAWLDGYEMKLWLERYPTLLPKQNPSAAPIKGKTWQATSANHLNRLQYYETEAYEPRDCVVQTRDGRDVLAVTFRWAGSPHSSQLSDGDFSLEHWQRHFKPYMF